MPVLLLAVLCLLAALRMPSAPALAGEPEIMASFSAGRALAEPAIERIILAALAERRVTVAGATLELAAVSARVAIPASATLAIERLAYQPAGQRFSAVLSAATPGQPTQRFTVAGRLRQEVQMPVLNRRLQAGEVITASDLQWVSVPDRGLPANAVYEPQELIGRTPRRGLPAGAPVLAADLKRPVVVAKGALVTLILNTGSMRLTARGRALGEGGIGDVISVANAQSRTIVAGVVIANGQVAVDATGMPPSR
jgi:flagellar basal body P-ring formation protein FlgA